RNAACASEITWTRQARPRSVSARARRSRGVQSAREATTRAATSPRRQPRRRQIARRSTASRRRSRSARTTVVVTRRGPREAATGPRETVETAVVRVVEVLQQPEATGPAQSERAAEIKRIARELFDFDEIARRALSRHWAGRTPVQHTEFVGLFTDLLERSYMNRIEAYAGERIVYTGEAVDGTFATVRSKVITQRRTELGIDYRMHLRGSR